jgi:hypothetical protein
VFQVPEGRNNVAHRDTPACVFGMPGWFQRWEKNGRAAPSSRGAVSASFSVSASVPCPFPLAVRRDPVRIAVIGSGKDRRYGTRYGSPLSDPVRIAVIGSGKDRCDRRPRAFASARLVAANSSATGLSGAVRSGVELFSRSFESFSRAHVTSTPGSWRAWYPHFVSAASCTRRAVLRQPRLKAGAKTERPERIKLHEFARKVAFRGRKLQFFDFGRFEASSPDLAQASAAFEAITRKFVPEAIPRRKIKIPKNSPKKPPKNSMKMAGWKMAGTQAAQSKSRPRK